MKDEGTEKAIRTAAKKLFFKEGRLQARMQEIADKAGVNRALLHYYFRDREQLFQTVLEEALQESFYSMFRILKAKQPFEKKVALAVSHIVDKLADYPFIESFVISEINREPAAAAKMPLIRDARKSSTVFLKEAESYLRSKHLHGIGPQDFLVNMMALCAYPAATSPIIMRIFGHKSAEHYAFLTKRKKMIVEILLGKMQ